MFDIKSFARIELRCVVTYQNPTLLLEMEPYDLERVANEGTVGPKTYALYGQFPGTVTWVWLVDIEMCFDLLDEKKVIPALVAPMVAGTNFGVHWSCVDLDWSDFEEAWK